MEGQKKSLVIWMDSGTEISSVKKVVTDFAHLIEVEDDLGVEQEEVFKEEVTTVLFFVFQFLI